MIYFIVNEHSRSGKGADVWKQLEELLKKEEVPYQARRTEYAGHAVQIAEEISSLEDEEMKLVAVGGDGTINEVVNGIVDFEKIQFGAIPTGSGNDFARGLGILETPQEILLRILESKGTKRIDIGSVSWEGCEKPRLFLISSGVGMDALVCKKALTSKLKKILNRLHLGKLTYLLITIQTILSMQTADTRVVIDQNRKTLYKNQIFSAAMNFRAEGGGIPMAPDADAQDGLLSVCTIHGIPKLLTFFVLPFLVAAKHERFRGVKIENCTACDLYMNKPLVLHTDGEYCGDVTEAHFKCLPGKLRILL
ncbi:MAG: diacylglycerol kinase family lipid kinase [Lachnospiraceae bacterium]|nr:diacylglycerol kinase family lipid kinase [Lachnospiraceae bacterium]